MVCVELAISQERVPDIGTLRDSLTHKHSFPSSQKSKLQRAGGWPQLHTGWLPEHQQTLLSRGPKAIQLEGSAKEQSVVRVLPGGGSTQGPAGKTRSNFKVQWAPSH